MATRGGGGGDDGSALPFAGRNEQTVAASHGRFVDRGRAGVSAAVARRRGVEWLVDLLHGCTAHEERNRGKMYVTAQRTSTVDSQLKFAVQFLSGRLE